MSSNNAGTNRAKIPAVPILSKLHSAGVPSRLLDAANDAKSRVYRNKTVSGVTQRQGELPVLPPGIPRDGFNAAIDELGRVLGSEHIVLNDKPLDDGWYLEHPSETPLYLSKSWTLPTALISIAIPMTRFIYSIPTTRLRRRQSIPALPRRYPPSFAGPTGMRSPSGRFRWAAIWATGEPRLVCEEASWSTWGSGWTKF